MRPPCISRNRPLAGRSRRICRRSCGASRCARQGRPAARPARQRRMPQRQPRAAGVRQAARKAAWMARATRAALGPAPASGFHRRATGCRRRNRRGRTAAPRGRSPARRCRVHLHVAGAQQGRFGAEAARDDDAIGGDVHALPSGGRACTPSTRVAAVDRRDSCRRRPARPAARASQIGRAARGDAAARLDHRDGGDPGMAAGQQGREGDKFGPEDHRAPERALTVRGRRYPGARRWTGRRPAFRPPISRRARGWFRARRWPAGRRGPSGRATPLRLVTSTSSAGQQGGHGRPGAKRRRPP